MKIKLKKGDTVLLRFLNEDIPYTFVRGEFIFKTQNHYFFEVSEESFEFLEERWGRVGTASGCPYDRDTLLGEVNDHVWSETIRKKIKDFQIEFLEEELKDFIVQGNIVDFTIAVHLINEELNS